MSKIQMLKPRIRMMDDPLTEWKRNVDKRGGRTLSDKRKSNGRTLALDGAAWRRLRAVVLREQPLCAHCHTAEATDVDHVDNDPSNNARENLAGLCHECHSRKTASDMGKRVVWGCDENGMPLDPNHHWNKSPATGSDKPSGKSSFPAKSRG
jgi:5-methylcytosine-specific restriction endonuclease McrA